MTRPTLLILLLLFSHAAWGRSQPKSKKTSVSNARELKRAFDKIEPRSVIELNTTTIKLNERIDSFLSKYTVRSVLLEGTTIVCGEKAAGAFGIFGAPATFSGIIFENCGTTSVVIAVSKNGPIVFDKVNFVDNRAGSMQSGGALSITGCDNIGCNTVKTPPIEVTIQNCEFDNNTAETGGAIFADNAVITVINSTFTGNSASLGGGALYVTGVRSILQAENTQFIANSVSGKGGSRDLRLKGGAKLEPYISTRFPFPDTTGGAIRVQSITRTIIEGCSFVENKAPAGGALAIETLWNANRSKLKIRFIVRLITSSFQRNMATASAKSGKKSNTESGALGGAIYTASTEPSLKWTTDSCIFEDNMAGHGAAMHVVTLNTTTPLINGSAFRHNQAEGYGGAFVIRNALTFTIAETEIVNNIARVGGGIALTNNASLLLEGLSGTTAEERFGRPVYFINNQARRGGAISCTGCGDISFSDTHLSQNIAEIEGGGLYIANTDATISIFQSRFENNRAISGGGAFFRGVATVRITSFDATFRTIFINNQAISGAGLTYDASSPTESRLLISNTDFLANVGLIPSDETKVKSRSVVHLILDDVPAPTVADILLMGIQIRDNRGYVGGGLWIDVDGKWNRDRHFTCPDPTKKTKPCRQLRFVTVSITTNGAQLRAPGLFVTDSEQVSLSCDAGRTTASKTLSEVLGKKNDGSKSVDKKCTLIDENLVSVDGTEKNVIEA